MFVNPGNWITIRWQKGVISLRNLLLIFTGILLVAVLIAGIVTSFGYFRSYVSAQLAEHARDGATAVGLSLSNAIDGADPVISSSLVDAVFDSGGYLQVTYRDTRGRTLAARSGPLSSPGVPAWFLRLVQLPLPVAEAEVVRGWQRLGKVQVVSDPGRAYTDLWRIGMGLVLGALIIGSVGLLALYLLLRRILRPLAELEAQAHALRRHDFRRRVTVRSTRELNRVTVAMNQMADDLGHLFAGQARLIQHLRRVTNEDEVTGLGSRSAFDQRLKTEVESEEKSAPGILVLLQLRDFAAFNRLNGRSAGDELLARVAAVIRGFLERHSGGFAGRRSGAEFAVYLPGALLADGRVWCQELVQELEAVYLDQASPQAVAVHAGLAGSGPGVGVRELLAAADEALRLAQGKEGSACVFADGEVETHHNMEAWRGIIATAIRERQLVLWLQPMLQEPDASPIYYQIFSRIHTAEGTLKAAVFVPMAERFGLVEALDRQLVQRALERLQAQPDVALAVSLAGASVASEAFRQDLLGWLAQAGKRGQNLWVGLSEQTVHYHRNAVGKLVRGLARLGVPVLVDHFGVGACRSAICAICHSRHCALTTVSFTVLTGIRRTASIWNR